MKTRWGVIFLAAIMAGCVAAHAAADPLDTWSIRSSGTSDNLTAVAYGSSNFVAVGLGGNCLSSTNGETWIKRSFGKTGGGSIDLLCACFGDGKFVGPAVPFSALTNILVSTDGSSWLGFRPARASSFYGVSYAGGVFILVGSTATIMTATNIDSGCAGRFTNCNWALRNYGGSQNLNGAAYGNGVYVVVGDSVSFTSTDAVTWVTNNVPSAWLNDVAFGKGIFVGVGLSRSVGTSSNGVQWTRRTIPSDATLARITFGNGTFVAVGDGGTILTSTDGISWKKRPSPTTAWLTGVTYGNGTFVATGLGGTILQSASVSIPILAASSGTGSAPVLSLTGEIGRGYRIQAVTSLAETNWTDVTVFTNTAATTEFVDPEGTNYLQRFYRAVSP